MLSVVCAASQSCCQPCVRAAFTSRGYCSRAAFILSRASDCAATGGDYSRAASIRRNTVYSIVTAVTIVESLVTQLVSFPCCTLAE